MVFHSYLHVCQSVSFCAFAQLNIQEIGKAAKQRRLRFFVKRLALRSWLKVNEMNHTIT